MMTLDKARKIVLKAATLRRVACVPLNRSHHRSLAEDVFTVVDAPEFSRSIVDGFAVRAKDASRRPPAVLKVVDDIFAGRSPKKTLKKDECSRIATGAVVPKGADAVAMKEDSLFLPDGRVKIFKIIRKGDNIHEKGKDLKKGRLLLKKGTALNEARVALLASQGFREVRVFDAPCVAILSTGDEIVEPGRKKQKVQVWNSTAAMLSYALAALNVPCDPLGIARDEPEQLGAKIRKGLKVDVLLITGAVSAGERDLVPAALRKAGVRIVLHKVAIRPGKPFLFGIKGRHLVFGLPGNPVSSLVCFFLFVKPVLEKILRRETQNVFCEGGLKKKAENTSGRLSFLPAKLCAGKNGLRISPLRSSGSADLRAAARADGFFVLGRRQTFASKDAFVKFWKVFG